MAGRPPVSGVQAGEPRKALEREESILAGQSAKRRQNPLRRPDHFGFTDVETTEAAEHSENSTSDAN